MSSALSLNRSIFAKRIKVEESKTISMYTRYYKCNRYFNRYVEKGVRYRFHASKQHHEAGLREVPVAGKCIDDVAFLHDGKANAVNHSPVFVRTLAVKLPALPI